MERIQRIDYLIEQQKNDLANDTIHFINRKSIKQTPEKNCPYGADIQAFLEYFKSYAKQEGLYIKDYGTGIISASLYDKEIDLGIWLHGDTVAIGEGWQYYPLNAVEYENCIIGRGATDNKGQLATIFNLFKIFKKLDIRLNYNPAIFLGSDEESGMSDLKDFLKQHTPPKLSLVPDGDFPVAYAGKGNLQIKLRSTYPLNGFSLEAGAIETPSKASAYSRNFNLNYNFKYATATQRNNCVELSVNTLPIHSSKPNKNGNMITLLTEELNALEWICEKDKQLLGFIHTLSKDIHGEIFSLKRQNVIAPLTMSLQQINNIEGFVELSLNIRYPIPYNEQEIEKKISEISEKHAFKITQTRSTTKPFIIPENDKILNLLLGVSNSVCEEIQPPYLVAGSTYAHLLPNAYIFGMSGNLPPASFPTGRGGAHGVDEAVSLTRLQRAMKIYARTLLALNAEQYFQTFC